MFAFGPSRTSSLADPWSTAVGIAGGLGMVWWMTNRLLTETLPEFALDVVIGSTTLDVVVVLGICAVTRAPVLRVRRMRRMDLSGMLGLDE